MTPLLNASLKQTPVRQRNQASSAMSSAHKDSQRSIITDHHR
jgi:hypothetical protein